VAYMYVLGRSLGGKVEIVASNFCLGREMWGKYCALLANVVLLVGNDNTWR
jgi:hypothetical protein